MFLQRMSEKLNEWEKINWKLFKINDGFVMTTDLVRFKKAHDSNSK